MAKTRQTFVKIAKTAKSQQERGIKSRARRPLYYSTVYKRPKTQHLALMTIVTCSARFSTVKLCRCGALKYIFLRLRRAQILNQKLKQKQN